MIAYRAFPWDPAAARSEPGGALWIPRRHQGAGRHDNPSRFGCLYASESETGVVAEALARFQNAGPLTPGSLRRNGLALALARLELPDEAEVIDLDSPRVLGREKLRPSQIATRERARTQADASALYARHPDAVALRWWSTLESSWLNLTIFGRGRLRIRLREVRAIQLGDPAVAEAAEILALELP